MPTEELNEELEDEFDAEETLEFVEGDDGGTEPGEVELDIDQIGAAAAEHIVNNPQSFEALAQRIAQLVAKQFKAPAQPTRVNLVFSQPKQQQQQQRQPGQQSRPQRAPVTQTATVRTRTAVVQDEEPEADAAPAGQYRMKPTRMVAKSK